MISNFFPDIIAVVPAAGIGRRMHSRHPKQYLKIGCITILEHSINKLLAHPAINQIVITIHPKDSYFKQLSLSKDSRILSVIGGKERAYSVLAGLFAIKKADWVLVHDASRPCLAEKDLQRLLQISQYNQVGGILAVPVNDTLKKSKPGEDKIMHTVRREMLWHAMTPQFFPLELLRKCLTYALNEGATISDEASALEYCGYHPELVIGRRDNIKITYPEDLELATYYLTHLNK